MSLDHQMIVSVLNSLKVMNLRFRADDVTDAIRDQLRPVMLLLDENCMLYIRLLREPKNITTTIELKEYRAIVKGIKLAPIDTLVAKVTEMADFIDDQIGEVLVHIVEDDDDEEDDNNNENETEDTDTDTPNNTEDDTPTTPEPSDDPDDPEVEEPDPDEPTDMDEPTDEDLPT